MEQAPQCYFSCARMLADPCSLRQSAGGDEFLYVLMNPQGVENIQRIAEALVKTIGQPIDMGELQPIIKASIGIAIYPDDGTTGEELIINADAAMYRAKTRTNGCAFFNA